MTCGDVNSRDLPFTVVLSLNGEILTGRVKDEFQNFKIFFFLFTSDLIPVASLKKFYDINFKK